MSKELIEYLTIRITWIPSCSKKSVGHNWSSSFSRNRRVKGRVVNQFESLNEVDFEQIGAFFNLKCFLEFT